MAGPSGSLLLVGGGKMGSALLHGWLAHGIAATSIDIVEPHAETAAPLRSLGLHGVVGDAADLNLGVAPELIVFAVKPQMLDSVLPSYRDLVGPRTTALPIVAGKSISVLEAVFGADTSIVRAMPNTPAAVGRGMSVLCANRSTSSAQRELAEQLMRAVGDVAWIEDEDLMHAVTAVSGSGPAYVFLLTETLAAAGVESGLPRDLAVLLARRTVEGAGALLGSSDEEADQLRRNVTSPGGTTEAALGVLRRDGGMPTLMTEAVAAAAARSRALA